ACAQGRCLWPEQVFVDGVELDQVCTTCALGSVRFRLDEGRDVVMSPNPAGHRVEVTTRVRWMTVTASDVTVTGMTFAHAGNGYLDAAFMADNFPSNVLLTHSTLTYAHGANVRGWFMSIEYNEIAYS